MDRLKGVAKGGWHPAGDRAIHRDSWKSDLMKGGKQKDPLEEQRNHQSAPLTSLRDPDSFGPPPKHSGWYGGDGAPTSPASSAGRGLGSAVPTPARRGTQEVAQQEEKPKATGPYRQDTTGLSTAHLPKPPVRRDNGSVPPTPPRSAASPPIPPRQARPAPAQEPPPVLPPRQNEYPDEYAPAPPPTYQEATVQPPARVQPAPHARPDPQGSGVTINGVTVNRLAQAGVNVPGFGIGGGGAPQAGPAQSPSTQGQPSQLSELQQRFSQMGTGTAAAGHLSSPPTASSVQKKPPPPPPPKKSALAGNQPGTSEGPTTHAPPPVPLGTKPRPS